MRRLIDIPADHPRSPTAERRSVTEECWTKALVISHVRLMPERLANSLQATTVLVVGRAPGGRQNSLVRKDLPSLTGVERFAAPPGLPAGEFTGG
jgi:hypothetical protein